MASLVEAWGGFKPLLAAADTMRLLELSNWALMIVGGVILLSYLAAGITHGDRTSTDLAPPRSCRLTPEILFVPILAYLLAVVALHPLTTWWLGETSASGTTETGDAVQVPTTAGVLANNLAHVVGAVACYLVGRQLIATRERPFVVGDRRYGQYFLDGLVGVLVAIALCQSALYLTMWVTLKLSPEFAFPAHDVIDALRAPDRPDWLPVALWIGVTLVTPVAEEFFFRGLLQTGLARALKSRWLAVVAASVIFGLAHSSQPHVIPAITLFGVILGLLYERRGSLVGPIIAHTLFNAKTLLWTALAGV